MARLRRITGLSGDAFSRTVAIANTDLQGVRSTFTAKRRAAVKSATAEESSSSTFRSQKAKVSLLAIGPSMQASFLVMISHYTKYRQVALCNDIDPALSETSRIHVSTLWHWARGTGLAYGYGRWPAVLSLTHADYLLAWRGTASCC